MCMDVSEFMIHIITIFLKEYGTCVFYVVCISWDSSALLYNSV